MRERIKDEAPFCVECQKEGRLEVWTDLDHIVPHRGDMCLFWDEENLQGLCASHHSAKTGQGL
jgi:5-methylcytosine-specific restriction protein A